MYILSREGPCPRNSLADAFAAALAKENKAELVAGETEFNPLEEEIKIHLLK